MNMNVSKIETKRLVAAVMAIALVACAVAVFASSEVSAYEESAVTDGAVTVSTTDDFMQAVADSKVTTINVNASITISEDVNLGTKTVNVADTFALSTAGNVTITGGTITGGGAGNDNAKQLIMPALNATVTFDGTTLTPATGGTFVYAIYAYSASIALDGATVNGTIGFDDPVDANVNTLTLNNGTIVDRVSYISSNGDREYVVGVDVFMDSTSKIKDSNLGYPTDDEYENPNMGTSSVDVGEGQTYVTDEVTQGKNSDEKKPALTVEPGADYYGPSNEFVNNNDSERLALSDSIIAVYDELPISGTAYIAGNNSTLTIPTGKVLRIMSGGTLDMAGNTLVVEGTLIIETGATVSNGGNIVLMRNGTFDNSGIIGAGRATTITANVDGITDSYDGVGSVTIQNVSGMTFGFVNTTGTNNTPTYTLTLTGDLIAEDTVNSISVNGARIVGDMYVGQDVTLDIQSSDIYSGTVITVDGALASNGKLNMHNGSEIIVNGQVTGAINAVTGDYLSSDGETKFVTDRATYTGTKQTAFTATADGGFVSRYTLSVGTYGFQKENGDQTEAWTAQRLYLNGTLAYNAPYDATALPTQGTITLTGNGIYVAADVTVVIPNGMTISNTGSPVTVLGTMQFDGRAVPGFDYVGSSYSVKSTGTPSVTTGYVTTFANAMGAIATAEQQKVTVKGDLDIDTEYTLAANQRLDISGAGEVVVKNGGSLTLEARSILTGEVDNVEGVMTIMKPNGSKAPANYSTIAEGTTEAGVSYTRYSGLQYALDNANSGETIAVVGVTEIEGNLTIPAGVTVSGENTISIDGNLVIEETAKLEMVDNNKLDMTGAKSKVTVNGELDLTEGQIAFSSREAKTDTALTSTVGTTKWGTQPIDSGDLPDAFNAVGYYDENNQIIMTSAEAAIAATSAQDINKYVVVSGNVTAGDFELTVDMLVRMDANATFGTVTLAEGVSILVNDEGRLTATVSAQTGVEGSESISTVRLDRVANIAVGETHVVDNQNVTTHQLYIAGVPTGAVTVSTGTVVVGNDVNSVMGFTENYRSIDFDGTGNVSATLAVAAGATLQVNNGMTLIAGDNGTSNDQPGVVIDGTLAVAESGTVTVDGILTVNGTMTVADGNTDNVSVTKTLIVTGTLDISTTEDDEAAIEVSGTLVVGEKITTMGGTTTGTVSGAVNFGSTGSVKVYNGASVDDAIIGGDANGDGVSDAESTAFHINGNLYMTVYADSMTINGDYLAAEDFALVGYDMSVSGGYNIEVLNNWYSDAEMTQTVNSAAVGNPEAMYFKVNASNVDVKVSVGSGISLYIDNVRYVSGDTVSLAVGTHNVTASVNPGYTGDVTIQFNGQTVTGEFTITPEMASNTYEGALTITATGDISYDTGSTGGDSGMGLTEILLIILVVLIVIMAIMVALRLMRS